VPARTELIMNDLLIVFLLCPLRATKHAASGRAPQTSHTAGGPKRRLSRAKMAACLAFKRSKAAKSCHLMRQHCGS
jgi:hypothetical protein